MGSQEACARSRSKFDGEAYMNNQVKCWQEYARITHVTKGRPHDSTPRKGYFLIGKSRETASQKRRQMQGHNLFACISARRRVAQDLNIHANFGQEKNHIWTYMRLTSEWESYRKFYN